MKIFSPYNQKEVGEIRLSSTKEAELIVANANLAKEEMKNISSGERAGVLQEIADSLSLRFEEFVSTIINESGKPRRYAEGEVKRAIQTFTIASEECKRIPHELFDIDGTEKGKAYIGEYYYFPKGVVLGISPFNFPLNLVAHKVAPAIAVGCPIILKPSDKTPLTAELLAEVIAKTKLPENGFQILHCSNEITGDLVEHPEIHILSFTGSSKIGWELKQKANKKTVILELGGNAAAIVTQSANFDKAIRELLVGGFAYSGQVCIHTQRIYVHSSIFEPFLSRYAQLSSQLIYGDPNSPDTEISNLINEENAIRIETWVNEAVQEGARLIIGGKREGSYYSPTVLTNVGKNQKVRNQEIFGPVVIVEPYQMIQEAINEVNDSEFGLQASIYTNDIQELNLTYQKLNVATLIHNQSTTFRVDDMPYGGIKNSGFGREGVRYAMKEFLEGKLLIKKR